MFQEGYEPKPSPLDHGPVALDAGGEPWWSEKVQQEAWLRHHRPEDLPVPHDGDLEDGGNAGWTGKGRGTSTGGGRVFVTPPSNRIDV